MRLAVAIILALVALPCFAVYPERPLRLVSPYVAGGLGDLTIRMIAERLSHSLAQPVLIDSKPGADGQIAAMEVRRAAPDGYTLLVGETTALSMVPAVRKEPPYDALVDFTPISHLASGAYFLVVHPQVPVRTLGQLVTHVRANPGALVIAASNAPARLTAAFFMRQAKIEMQQISYRGELQAMPDLLNGQVQVMIATPFPIAQSVKEGKLRVLAATLPNRSQPFPDAPTFRELGFADTPPISWVGLFGPAKLPTEITARLSRETVAALAQPALRDELEKRGAAVRSSTPAELRDIVRTQLDFWHGAVRSGLMPRD